MIQSLLTLVCVLSLVTNSFAEPDDDSLRRKTGKPVTVGILIFEGVELMDFAGPAEVFAVSDYGKSFKVSTVAKTTETLRAMGGIKIVPDFSADKAPKFDVVVIPGGAMGNVDAATRKWIKDSSKDADIVMSVCMGAFLLADAGLLDGIEATTHHWGIAGLKRSAPKCKVVSDRRFVDSGHIVTTAGVTAGIDGALRIVERFYGEKAASWTANEWMEHRQVKLKTPAKVDEKTRTQKSAN
jgi:transcriptional regulator GlxA family with amidase domain